MKKPRLHTDDITVGYDKRVIIENLTVAIPDGKFTVIVGPNAGESTPPRALSRLLKPSLGAVLLDGKAITSYPAKEVARRLGLLPQTSIAPDGISVADLVARGRYPHQKLIRQWSTADEAAVVQAMDATGVTSLSARPVDELSGGQQQRVWVAMVLVQTPLLLLDEPTTFLDIAHQIRASRLVGHTAPRERQHTGRGAVHDPNLLAASALSAIQQAAISIDHFGLVLEANPAAEALFDDSLYTANWHLIMSDPLGRNAFKALVERLIVPDTDIPSLAPIVVRREGKHPIIAKALQVPAAARNIFFGTRAILILDPVGPKSRPNPSLLSQAFGLTSAEAKLAARLRGRHEPDGGR